MAEARRTQAQRRAETRRVLLEAARGVFGERGYGTASLDEIAARAGLTRGALYYNFPGGKEDLFLALLDERLAARTEAMRSRFAAGAADPIAAAAAAADEAQGAVGPNREWQLLRFEFALHAAREPGFARRWREHEDATRRAIEELVADSARRLGVAPPLPPRELAVGLRALATGLAFDELVEPGSVPDGLFGRLLALLARGALAQTTTNPGGTP